MKAHTIFQFRSGHAQDGLDRVSLWCGQRSGPGMKLADFALLHCQGHAEATGVSTLRLVSPAQQQRGCLCLMIPRSTQIGRRSSAGRAEQARLGVHLLSISTTACWCACERTCTSCERTCSCLRGVSRWFTPLACGPGSPELSKSYMDMASKLFTFTSVSWRVAANAS